jgi:DNA-binding HxlR family transcriptional regulator
MRVLDGLGRRWALRVLWELRHGPLTFRALREACDDVSPSSLNQRLRELRALGVIALGDDGYGLTASGVQLSRIMLDLVRWAEQALGKRPPPAPRAVRGRRSLDRGSRKSHPL